MKKQRNNKGFSLVEIIVVLVIMAILAAVSIPALTGFIDEAKGKGYITEARTAYIAAQAYVSEKVGSASGDTAKTAARAACKTALEANISGGVLDKMMTESYTTGAKITSVTITGTRITELVYVVDGKQIKLTPGSGAEITDVP